MPDITNPATIRTVEPRRDGRSHGGAADHGGPPPKKVVETYQESDRVRPPDDRITIIGIPIDQITAATQAALAGLVAENATLRAQVRRLEVQAGANLPPLLERDAFLARLSEALAQSPGPGCAWMVLLVHVQTYEDIRRSTGLLAANSALADVGERLRRLTLRAPPPEHAPITAVGDEIGLRLVGGVGGLSLAALTLVPEGVDPAVLARQATEALSTGGYDVAGLSMSLSLRAAAAVAGVGESPLLAIARVDHLSRGAA
jgi:hypothetical protein